MNKSIRGRSEIISNLKCEHDLEIIDEEIFSEDNIKILAKCRHCGKEYYFKTDVQKELI